MSTADIHGNPTPHAPDEFVVELQAGIDLTNSGTYLFAVTQKTTGGMVGGTRYGIRVQPAPPSAAKSTHNIAVGMELVSENEILQELRVLSKNQMRRAKRAVGRMMRKPAGLKSRRRQGESSVRKRS